MSDNPSVNRCLKDKAFDHIDHALGRPIFPLRKSYRNYFAIDASEALAAQFRGSPHWKETASAGGMSYFSVTTAGRQALAAYLVGLDEPWGAFTVSYRGQKRIIPAKSRGKAKYTYYLDISDVRPDLTFLAFARAATVRRAS